MDLASPVIWQHVETATKCDISALFFLSWIDIDPMQGSLLKVSILNIGSLYSFNLKDEKCCIKDMSKQRNIHKAISTVIMKLVSLNTSFLCSSSKNCYILSFIFQEYEAFKKHSNNLLAKEKNLNSQLRNLVSQEIKRW